MREFSQKYNETVTHTYPEPIQTVRYIHYVLVYVNAYPYTEHM